MPFPRRLGRPGFGSPGLFLSLGAEPSSPGKQFDSLGLGLERGLLRGGHSPGQPAGHCRGLPPAGALEPGPLRFGLSGLSLGPLKIREYGEAAMNRPKPMRLLLITALLLLPALRLAAQETPTDKPSQAPADKSADKASPDKGKGDQGWTYKKFLKVFKKSGRTTDLTAKEFDRLQERKLAMLKDIHRYLDRKFGWADPRLMKAFEDLPR